jgi:hypothetical protein
MTQLARLSDYEERAEQAVKDVNLGIERFASVLKEIKDLGLYKGEHDTFEDYCRERWGRSLRTVQRALKAHDTRQKLLEAAPEAEKPHIQKASTTAILAAADQMDHLVIGRKQPTATKTADFYSSNEPVKVVLNGSEEAVAMSTTKIPDALREIMSDTARQLHAKAVIQTEPDTDRQIAQRVLLAFIEKQPEEHRDYLRWVAQEIAK